MSSVRIALVAAVVFGVLVAVGRWERSSDISSQLTGLRRVLALVGPLDQHELVGYRRQPAFDCLVYKRAKILFALELCIDHSGRLVEAIDRRHVHRRIYSLREEPSSSTIRLDETVVERLLNRMIRSSG
jgi:hypothetical protein